VEVCPVDCFKEGPNFLVIDPDECIDCGVCVPECPVDAIVPDTDKTIDVVFWTELNTRLAKKCLPLLNVKMHYLMQNCGRTSLTNWTC